MVDQADGVYAHFPTSQTPGIAQRPWELTSQTLQQYRVENELAQPQWVPAVASQDHDPLAGAYTPGMEIKPVPNTRSLNRAFRGAQGSENLMPHTAEDIEYMVPPKFGWRTEEIGIVDIMQGTFTRISDPQNPVNSGYIDDFSGGNGGYTGALDHNSMTIPQGL
jgi:hypothetical protein